jgi:hypothetical protein
MDALVRRENWRTGAVTVPSVRSLSSSAARACRAASVSSACCRAAAAAAWALSRRALARGWRNVLGSGKQVFGRRGRARGLVRPGGGESQGGVQRRRSRHECGPQGRALGAQRGTVVVDGGRGGGCWPGLWSVRLVYLFYRCPGAHSAVWPVSGSTGCPRVPLSAIRSAVRLCWCIAGYRRRSNHRTSSSSRRATVARSTGHSEGSFDMQPTTRPRPTDPLVPICFESCRGHSLI